MTRDVAIHFFDEGQFRGLLGLCSQTPIPSVLSSATAGRSSPARVRLLLSLTCVWSDDAMETVSTGIALSGEK